MPSAEADLIMAHTRKDTLTQPPEWWKHLKPFNKRRVSKRERQAGRKSIEVDSRIDTQPLKNAPIN
jgi:hypothetical protein